MSLFVAYSLEADAVLYKGNTQAEALRAIAGSRGIVTLKEFVYPRDDRRTVGIRETKYANGQDSGIPSTYQVLRRGELEALVDFAGDIIDFPDYARKTEI